jgi:hypothetical protein
MLYYLGKRLTVSFDAAVTRTIDALKKEGFGDVGSVLAIRSEVFR